jgi:hypothetical protein
MNKTPSKPPLIAVVTCELYVARANACRRTWVTKIAGKADVLFFLAKQDREPMADEVFLDCDDDYHGLPRKVQLTFAWALAHDYTLVFKTDDDVFINPENLLGELPKKPYVGHHNPSNPNDGGEHEKFAAPTGWNSGMGYWLNKKAMTYVIAAAIPEGEWAEDRWVGKVLYEQGIKPVNDVQIYPASCTPKVDAINANTKCTCEFTPDELQVAHDGPKGWKQRAAVAAEKRKRQLEQQQRQAKIMRGDGTPFF